MMTKKIASLVLTAVMAVSMLAGCGANANTSSGGSGVGTAPADGKIKIGVSIWNSTDALGSKCKEIIDAAADALDVDVQYVDQGHVSEQVTASVDQLVASGCQGIIICNSSDSEMTPVIKTCTDNQVYLAQFFRIISETNSPAVYQAAKESPYYVGAVHENEPENGRKLINMLLDAGYRDVGLIGWEQGDATWLGRWEGYQAGANDWNSAHPDDPVTLSEPQYAGTTAEGGTKAADALMAADPGLDAMIPAGGGGEPLLGAIAAIATAGKTGEIGVVSTDFLDDLGEALQDGRMTGESGGHYCDPLFAFMMVYNAIRGKYTGFDGQINEIQFPYLYVADVEGYASYDEYKKYFVDRLPYTQEELKSMAELDMDALREKAAALSIADAAARAGN